jgi:hypothetical protein
VTYRLSLLAGSMLLAALPAFAAPASTTPNEPTQASAPAAKAPTPVTPRAGGTEHAATARLGEPFSTVASNIDPADTRSTIAPRLPTPTALENDAPAGYLKAARQALDARRTGAAQQALEMAETRLLDRSVPKGSADVADQAPAVMMVRNALTDLGRNDLAGARAKIDTALADIGQAPQRI